LQGIASAARFYYPGVPVAVLTFQSLCCPGFPSVTWADSQSGYVDYMIVRLHVHSVWAGTPGPADPSLA
jgi:hypothetical protein